MSDQNDDYTAFPWASRALYKISLLCVCTLGGINVPPAKRIYIIYWFHRCITRRLVVLANRCNCYWTEGVHTSSCYISQARHKKYNCKRMIVCKTITLVMLTMKIDVAQPSQQHDVVFSCKLKIFFSFQPLNGNGNHIKC